MESHILRLGDVSFATNTFELYLEFGQQIKARSAAAQTFIVQLSPGGSGYLPSARAEQLGGYGGMIINGVVYLEDVLRRINGLPKSRLHELAPGN